MEEECDSVLDKGEFNRYSKTCCKICSLKFTLKPTGIHNKKCDICKMWFFNQQSLEYHRKVHWCYNYDSNGKLFE